MSEQTEGHSPTPYSEPHGQAAPTMNRAPAQQPYRHTTTHITQEPIDDVEPEYVTRERYVTLEKMRKPKRVHMGVAESDPEYLSPPTGGGRRRGRQADDPTARKTLHYDRYLELPKQGKSIFTRRERARKRTRRLVALLAILIVIAIVVWVLFLR